MASQTISSLKYQLFLDTMGLAKGTREAKKEFNLLKKSARTAETGAEKLQDEFENLARAARNEVPGALSLLNKRLDQIGKKLNRNGKAVDTYATKWKRAKTNITGAIFSLKTLGAVLVGGAIARGAKRQTEKLDDLNKRAKQLGTTVEFLSTLQFRAGQEIGFEADQVSKAIEKMTRRIGEAAIGTGEAKAIFEAYNIEVAQFVNRDPEQVFRLLAKAFKDVKSEQEGIVIGTKLFDDELARMFSLMQDIENVDLTKGMITQGDVDSATALVDEMGEMAVVWDQFASKMVSGFGPVFTGILTELNLVLDRLPGFGRTWKPQAKTFGQSTQAFGRSFGQLVTGEQVTPVQNLIDVMTGIQREQLQEQKITNKKLTPQTVLN